MKINTRNLVLMALFIALSFVGAQLKIFSTIAFDSLPAFLATLLMGPVYGAIIAVIGHLLTALTSGFPMTLPVHLVIALGMGLTMVAAWFTFTLIKKVSNEYLALLAFVLIAGLFNGPVLLLLCSPLLVPMLTWAGLTGMMPLLGMIGGLNALIAVFVYKALPQSIKEQIHLETTKQPV